MIRRYVIFLAVIEAPAFLAQLKGVPAEAGKTLELTAAINRVCEPVEVIWQKDNKPLDRKAQGITASCQNGQYKLKIDSCSLTDAGLYSVTVKNPLGSATSSAKITIKGISSLYVKITINPIWIKLVPPVLS